MSEVSRRQMTPDARWHERMEALLAEQGNTPESRVSALSYHVPSGYLFMDAAEVERIHNESEALRIERDGARTDRDRLRALYENAVGNREKFGWTIDHLLECDEALRTIEAEIDRLNAELHKQEAVLVAADRLHEAYDAMLNGDDVGRLPPWQPRPEGPTP